MSPERQTASPVESPAAVDRIFSWTESAVASIVRRTEHQVRQVGAEADARASREAIDRLDRLAELRRELIDRATALALHYEDVLDQVDAVEAALLALAGERTEWAEPAGIDGDIVASLNEAQRRRGWHLRQPEAA